MAVGGMKWSKCFDRICKGKRLLLNSCYPLHIRYKILVVGDFYLKIIIASSKNIVILLKYDGTFILLKIWWYDFDIFNTYFILN